MNLKLLFIGVFLIANAFAEGEDIGMLVLVDRDPLFTDDHPEVSQKLLELKEAREKKWPSPAEHRSRALAQRTATIEAMRTSGYVPISDRAANNWPTRIFYFLFPLLSSSLENITPELGYEPMSLAGTPFEDVQARAFGTTDSDDKIHSLLYRFKIPELGYVYLTEESYSTSIGVGYRAIMHPLGNIIINGEPATFVVLKSNSGDGNTSVELVVDGRLLGLSVHEPLEPGDKKLALFKDLASYLN